MERVPKSFKQKRSFQQRREHSTWIRQCNPNKVPVIVERMDGERNLPILSHSKFLVPDHLTMGEFIKILRRRLQLNPSQGIFMLINERCIASCSMTMAQLDQREQDPDGFIYMVFASQDVFG